MHDSTGMSSQPNRINVREAAEQLNIFFTHVAENTLENQKSVKSIIPSTYTVQTLPQFTHFKETIKKAIITIIKK